MGSIRAVYRLILFLIVSVGILTIFCLGLIVCLNKKERRIRWKNWITSRLAGIIASLMGLSMKIIGTPPQPPFFLISNHLSYIDILPFWKHLKTTFIAKSEIRKWPFFGLAARLFGVIFINRQNRKDINRVNKYIEENLGNDQGIILFPEGTSSKGEKVLPFKSSLLYYPASQKLPVYYASISYRINGDGTKKAWKDVCWWGDMDFLSHFWGLLKIKSWTAAVHFAKSPVMHENRKELTQKLQQKLTENFIPTFRE